MVLYMSTMCDEDDQSGPDCIVTLSLLQENLVDFAVTPTHLWTLWTNTDGETMVYFAAIEG